MSEYFKVKGILVEGEPTPEALRSAVAYSMTEGLDVIFQASSGVQYHIQKDAVLASITRAISPQRPVAAVEDWSDAEPGLSVVRGGAR